MNAEYYAVLAEHLATIERCHRREMRLIARQSRDGRAPHPKFSGTKVTRLRLVYSSADENGRIANGE